MDALRHNRTKEYIPENLLPRNPSNGEVMLPNSFDNAYIQYSSPMAEGASYKIEREKVKYHMKDTLLHILRLWTFVCRES